MRFQKDFGGLQQGSQRAFRGVSRHFMMFLGFSEGIRKVLGNFISAQVGDFRGFQRRFKAFQTFQAVSEEPSKCSRLTLFKNAMDCTQESS